MKYSLGDLVVSRDDLYLKTATYSFLTSVAQIFKFYSIYFCHPSVKVMISEVGAFIHLHLLS